MRCFHIYSIVFFTSFACTTRGQEVPIINYAIDDNDQILLEVNSTEDDYFILKVRNKSTEDFSILASMTMGENRTTVITEPLSHYPIEHYQVLKYSIQSPFDSDDDGIDDIIEFQDRPLQSPLNFAESLELGNGLVSVDNLSTFDQLAVSKDDIPLSPFLEGKKFVKYLISDFESDHPKVFFINSKTHDLHKHFANGVGIDLANDDVQKGELIYHPTVISNNGKIGAFTFNFSNGHGQPFVVVQRCIELLAANMPFLKNNLSYFITANNESDYNRDKHLFDDSRVSILFEKDIYADIDYLALNIAEGYGLFRHISSDEVPGARDIVLYESLPNALPHVSGIMTSIIQTPLSHVNLRAIQDNIPNAFIRNPLSIDSIANFARLCAALAFLTPFLYTLFFSLLQRGFDYPAIMNRDPDTVLRAVAAGGSTVARQWLGALVAAALAGALALAMHRWLREAEGGGRPWLGIATLSGVLASLFTMLDLAQWAFLLPSLAADYVDPAASATTKNEIRDLYESVHQYIGMGIGLYLATFFSGLWTLLTAWAMRGTVPFGRPAPFGQIVPWVGLLAGLILLLSIAPGVGFDLWATINTVGFGLWGIWLAGAAFLLWRYAGSPAFDQRS